MADILGWWNSYLGSYRQRTASMPELVAEGGKLIGARGSLLSDVPSFHQKNQNQSIKSNVFPCYNYTRYLGLFTWYITNGR